MLEAEDDDRPDEEGEEDDAGRQRKERPGLAEPGPEGSRSGGGARRGAHATSAGAVAPASCSRLPVAISSPTSSGSPTCPSRTATSSPAVHHADPVGELEDLVELGRDEQDRRARVALGDRLLVDELDAAHVEAAGRLVEDQEPQVAAELARHDRLLLVAAGQRAGGDGFATASGCRTASMSSRAASLDRAVVLGRARARRAAGSRWSGRGCRRAGSRGRARTGGGRPARRPRPPRSCARGLRPVTSAPPSVTRPAVGRRRPVIASTSSSWPLPATPAIPKISPARTSRLTPRTASWPRSSLAWSASTLSIGSPGWDVPRSTVSWTSRPTIISARSSSFVSAGIREPDDPAAPDDRDPVGDLEDLVELVADEDDAVALGGQAAQDGEDLLRLLRREHGGRLVEDEDPGVAVERLQDLDPLLPADREVLDLRVGVDLEAEPRAQLADPARGPRAGPGRSGWPSSPRRGGCSRPPSGPGPA